MSLFTVVKTAFLYKLCVGPLVPYLCTAGVDRCFCLLYQIPGSPREESRTLNGRNTDSSQVLSCLVLVLLGFCVFGLFSLGFGGVFWYFGGGGCCFCCLFGFGVLFSCFFQLQLDVLQAETYLTDEIMLSVKTN